MMKLVYHLAQDTGNGKLFLSLSPGFTLEKLKRESSDSLEIQALRELVRRHLKRLPLKSPTEQITQLHCLADESFDLLKQLSSTGRLLYQDKKVVVDPFSSLKLVVALKQDQSFDLKWRLKEQQGLLEECDWVFAADPAWILQGGIIRSFVEGADSYWLKYLLKREGKLERQELFEFLQEAKEDILIETSGEEICTQIEPLPVLALSDRHGAFANLWFDYGSLGLIAGHDAKEKAWKNKQAEKGWESDLLETDFIKKRVDSSHYYCPLDCVAKSLTFLLDIGWKIVDAQERQVMRETALLLDGALESKGLIVRGHVSYGDHKAQLQDVMGAFNRRERFMQLSDTSVALIDPQSWEAQGRDFSEGDVQGEGLLFAKNRIGSLSPLLEQARVVLKEEIKTALTRWQERVPSTAVSIGKGFQGELFAYQQKGLEWLSFLGESNLGGLLADDMGLGKTVQILAFFSQLQKKSPFLVVVPTSLLFNWEQEIGKFLPSLSIYRYEGQEVSCEELESYDLILVSYARLRLSAALFETLRFEAIALDEAQVIKNPDSQIARVCCSLQARVRIAMTGTPIENRFEDLFSLFHFLQPDLLKERSSFLQEMALASSNPLILKRIQRRLKPFLLRRKKEDVLTQLPSKLEQTVFVEMTPKERSFYEEWLHRAKRKIFAEHDGATLKRMQVLEAILRLRQLCCHPFLVQSEGVSEEEVGSKLSTLMSDLEEVVQEGHKVLVYSQFTQMLKMIESQVKKKGWKSVYLDGSTKDREGAVRQFQEDESTSIFLISLKAGGVGLNLTAADYVFLYDPWWNEAAERQAIDRAHRLGRESTVIARRYVTALSIEEKVMHLKAQKQALSDSILEGDLVEGSFSLEDMLALFD